ncbi:hypothetical protein ABG768_018586 [Culter alburnus]|uniref:HAT C-terminal dimerisation domain-containing protein n=1 Tax=Culter alburnus TaxID=194366 RepID=A0AAW1YUJ0_CULAL
MPISRKTISDKQIPVLKLETQAFVSVTTDLWSDRRLRSFPGVTAHVHFTGRHTGEQIASAFEEIPDEYGIRQKISYIVTDNAANMKCAFKVHMPQQQADDPEKLPWSSGERLSCFAHSLQLVINDGMEEVRAISRTIAKTSRFTTLLHSSSQFRDKFEVMFDTNKTVSAANITHWNSTFKQVRALAALDHKTLKVYDDVVFSACEWNQLKELNAVLAPFYLEKYSVENTRREGDETDSGVMNVDPASDSPPIRCPCLLSRYKAHKKRSSALDSSISTQINKYFDAIQDSDPDTALVFWAKNQDKFPHLHNLAMKVLSVPASSAPVERVFSRGGIMCV